MYSNETIKSFIDRCQKRLDQELDTSAQFWSVAELLEYMNEGIREMFQSVRETHENWNMKEMTSLDPIARIGGRQYNPAVLQMKQDRSKLYLPPDFQELVWLEPLRPTGTIDPFLNSITFEYRKLSQRQFRRDSFDTFEQASRPEVRFYLYDVVFGGNGAYILLSTPGSLVQPIDIRIRYLNTPPALTLADTFELTGLTDFMTDAILAYVCFAAVRKEDLTENLQTFGQTWALKRELAIRNAGPRQTRDAEPVEGWLEDEL